MPYLWNPWLVLPFVTLRQDVSLIFSNLDRGSRFPMNFYYLCLTAMYRNHHNRVMWLEQNWVNWEQEWSVYLWGRAIGSRAAEEAEGGSWENLHFRFENFLKVWIGRVPSFFYIELTLNCDLMQSRYALASPLESPLRRIAPGWAIKVQLHNSCWRIVESQESTLNLRAINKCNKYVIFSLGSIWLLIKDGLIHHFDLKNIDNFESPCYFPHFDFTVN